MSEEEKVEPYYAKRGQEVVDMLFDKGFLAPDLALEATRWLADYLGWYFQSTSNSAVKCALLTKKVRERKP